MAEIPWQICLGVWLSRSKAVSLLEKSRGGEFEGLDLRRWSLSAARSARYSAKKSLASVAIFTTDISN